METDFSRAWRDSLDDHGEIDEYKFIKNFVNAGICNDEREAKHLYELQREFGFKQPPEPAFGEPSQKTKDMFWSVWHTCSDSKGTVNKDDFFHLLRKQEGFTLGLMEHMFDHMIEMSVIQGCEPRYKLTIT